MKSLKGLAEARRYADRVEQMTVAEAAELPGMLGRIASAVLAARGWYGYIDLGTNEHVLIVKVER